MNRQRGYLWQSLAEEIVDEFEVLTPTFSIPTKKPMDEHILELVMQRENDAVLESVAPQARVFRQKLADKRKGVVKTQSTCSRCNREVASDRKQCEYHLSIARKSMKKRGSMRERLEDIREGLTLHFNVTTKAPSGTADVDGYLQTGTYPDGRLGEIFVRIGKSGSSDALLDQWAIAFSMALQLGADVNALCGKFVGSRFEPCGPTNVGEVPRCTSLVDLICRWLLIKYGKKDDGI